LLAAQSNECQELRSKLESNKPREEPKRFAESLPQLKEISGPLISGETILINIFEMPSMKSVMLGLHGDLILCDYQDSQVAFLD
jgi:hypothetical protein